MPFFANDGHRLFFREKGHGPLLLILPGSTATSAHYVGEMDYFSARFHVAAIDFWGTGRSDRIQGNWPGNWWQRGAMDAAALVHHLGHDHAVVLGSSGGAVTALLMAILFPLQVRIVIADSCQEEWPKDRLCREVAERGWPEPEMVAFWQHGHGEDWRAVVDADSDLLLRFAELGGNWFQGRLREVGCPVLFAASLEDEVLTDVAQQVVSMAGQVALGFVFLSNRGSHPLIWSRPEIFRAAAGCFLERAMAAGSGGGD